MADSSNLFHFSFGILRTTNYVFSSVHFGLSSSGKQILPCSLRRETMQPGERLAWLAPTITIAQSDFACLICDIILSENIMSRSVSPVSADSDVCQAFRLIFKSIFSLKLRQVFRAKALYIYPYAFCNTGLRWFHQQRFCHYLTKQSLLMVIPLYGCPPHNLETVE